MNSRQANEDPADEEAPTMLDTIPCPSADEGGNSRATRSDVIETTVT